MLWRLLNSRIDLRFAAVSFLVQTTLLILLVSIGVITVQQRMTEQANQHVQYISETLSVALAVPLVSRDWGRISDILVTAYGQEGIEYVVLTSLTGRILFSEGLSETEGLPSPDHSIQEAARDDGIFDTRVSISFADKSYGYLHLGISTLFLRQAITELTFWAIMLGTLAVIISAALMFLLSRRISKNLHSLAVTADSLAQGDLSNRADLNSSDEVGTLAHAFNSMASQLELRLKEQQGLARLAEQAQQQAEAASRAKSEFLANMSHEIRTPLNAVIGLGQLLNDSDIQGKHRDYLDKLNRSSRLLLRVINDILDISKIEAAKLELNPEPFNLKELLDNIENLFSESAKEKGLNFKVESEPGLPMFLVGDSLRLEQVLVNLVSNAVKFTEYGTVRLVVASAGDGDGDGDGDTQTEEANTDHSPCHLVFKVEDSGVGMSEKFIEIIFQPFAQADSSSTRRHGGSGLGLAISRRLIDAMGSELKLSSKEGVGTSFYFTLRLPAICDEEEVWRLAHQQNKSDKQTPDLSAYRILLAEDNELNRLIARDMLIKTGAEVISAANGLDALAKLNDNQVDLVLMDLQMPVMDGISATKEIRKRETAKNATHPRIPIIALSAAVLDADREAARAAGMDAFLAKPIEEGLLFNEIIKHLPARTKKPLPPSAASDPAPTGFATDTLVSVPAAAQTYATASSLSPTIATENGDKSNQKDNKPAPDPKNFPRLNGFDLRRGQMISRSQPEKYVSLLRLFSQQLKEKYRDLPENLERISKPELKHRLHSLKGLVSTVGAIRLSEISTELYELYLEEKKFPPELVIALKEAIEEALNDVARHIPPEEIAGLQTQKTPHPEDEGKIKATLARLRQQLDARDFIEDGELKPTLNLITGKYGQEQASELERLIENMDYKAAMELIDHIADDNQASEQSGNQADRQTGRQAGRQTDRQTDKQATGKLADN